MSFDAGALIFKIQTAGYQTFEQQMQSADKSVARVGQTSADAKPKLEGVGTATEQVGKKAQTAKAPLEEQAKSTKKVGDESDNSEKKQRKQKETTEQQAESAKKLSVVLLAAGVAVSALVGLSVAKFAEFDEGMSNVRAATMATAAEQKQLGEAALEAGADTAYSASEAAAAQEELAKAGQSVANIVGGSLNGALALAAAGQLQVARSAEIMATTLTQFRLPAEQAAHVSDVLAAGAGKAQGSVDDLALALSYVGPLAGSVGLSLNETAGTIAYFATQGIVGEKAGTSLRGVLASLQAPSAAADKELKKYSISVFDGAGNMLSMAGIAEQLRARLGGLTEQERLAALGRIFGNESLNAATLLYEGGAAKVEEWTAAVDDSGFAAEQAAMRQDNLAGDVEKLGGAFDTALIRTGTAANDVLREMVQSVTALVDWYGELSAPVQGATLVIGLATGAILLMSGAAVGLRAKFLELKTTMDGANASLRTTALVGAGAGLALATVVTVIGMVAQAHAEGRARAQAYMDTLEQGTNKVTAATREATAEFLSAKRDWWVFGGSSVFDNAAKLGLDLDLVTDAAMGNTNAMEQLQNELAEFSTEGDAGRAKAEELGLSLTDLATYTSDVTKAVQGEADSLEDAIEASKQKNDVTEEGTEITQTSAAAYIEAAGGVSDLETELRKLIDLVNESNSTGQDAITSNIAYQDSIAKVDEAIRLAKEGTEGYAVTLDQGTQAGRDNMGMLVDLAQDAWDAAEAQHALDGDTEAYKQRLVDSRQALLDRIHDLGVQGDEAEALADKILTIPSETEWKVIAETAGAQWTIDKFLAANASKRIHIAVGAGGSGGITQADGGKVEFYANGGRSENHVAQFARAGTYRVWAEDETGGEWYLPNAPAKRQRSLMLAEQMLDEWGFAMVPKGATAVASGAAGPAAAAAGTRVDKLVSFEGANFFSFDPHEVGREAGDKLSRVLDAHGI